MLGSVCGTLEAATATVPFYLVSRIFVIAEA